MDQLNPAQREAVLATEHLLCCACPGSGKTRVIVERVRRIQREVRDARILVTTFSREAAREMRKRIQDGGAGRGAAPLVIGTFHGLAFSQLRGQGRVGRVLSEVEVRHMAMRAAGALHLKLNAEQAEEVVTLCKIDPDYARTYPDGEELVDAYQALLEEAGALDFTDMLIAAVSGMQEGSLAPIAADHILVDEAQDIDRLQLQWLAAHLKQPCTAMAVGDDDQCIYAFRRALGHRGMQAFAQLTGARTVTLGENYRSTAGILKHAGQLIAHNRLRIPKTMRAWRGEGAVPQVAEASDGNDQIARLVEWLDRACAANPKPQPTPERPAYRFTVKPGQAAVLARTHAHLLKVEQAFIGLRIPYVRTGKRLWDRPEGQTLESLLRSLESGQGIGLEVALRWAKVPDPTIARLRSAGGGNLAALLNSGTNSGTPLPADATNPIVGDLLRHGPAWRRHVGRRRGDPAGTIYGATNWMISVLRGECGDQPQQSVPAKALRSAAVVEALRDSLAMLPGTLTQRLMLARQDKEAELPRVSLCTFHAAKGLEWGTVALIDVVDGVVPKLDETSGDEEVEEERRLLYVAMTRAKDNLVIFTRAGANRSPFLQEAGFAPPAANRARGTPARTPKKGIAA